MEIIINKVSQSKVSEVDFNNLKFGTVFTDHMLEVDYVNGKWQTPVIRPFEKLQIHPGNAALHYGQSIFEGMKATRNKEGNPLLFRVDKHIDRLNESARRMCMPELPQEIFEEGLRTLIYLEKAWIPPMDGSALYIRPFMFAIDEFLGVRPSETYKFMILLLPVGPYYSAPVKLKAEETYVRATYGGVGEAKTAGNYAASLYPAKLAQQEGYDQVMWLDGKEFKYVQEVGTMNLFFVIDGKILTPETDGAILKGITRDTAIQLFRQNGYEVEVRKITIEEIMKAGQNGSLSEIFGAGTAAVVAKVKELRYKDESIFLDAANYPVASWIYDQFIGIRNQSIPDVNGWVEEVTEDSLVTV
jgi:branched-chain amino acid aminotransferase